MSKRILAAVTMAFTVLLAGTVLAGTATDIVKDKQTELFKVIAKPASKARDEKLKALFDEMLAYDHFAKASLGDKWNDLDAEQREQFSSRLTRLVRCTYKRNLTRMLDYRVEYVGEEAQDGTTLVLTRADHKKDKDAPPIEIDFRMKQIDGAWKAVDIVTERASLTQTYKSQFLRILKQDNGFAKLLEKMDAKIKKDGC